MTKTVGEQFVEDMSNVGGSGSSLVIHYFEREGEPPYLDKTYAEIEAVVLRGGAVYIESEYEGHKYVGTLVGMEDHTNNPESYVGCDVLFELISASGLHFVSQTRDGVLEMALT